MNLLVPKIAVECIRKLKAFNNEIICKILAQKYSVCLHPCGHIICDKCFIKCIYDLTHKRIILNSPFYKRHCQIPSFLYLFWPKTTFLERSDFPS